MSEKTDRPVYVALPYELSNALRFIRLLRLAEQRERSQEGDDGDGDECVAVRIAYIPLLSVNIRTRF